MKNLKHKIHEELKELDERMATEDFGILDLEDIYNLSKTYYYVCKADEWMEKQSDERETSHRKSML